MGSREFKPKCSPGYQAEADLPSRYAGSPIIGTSPQMREVHDRISAAASTDFCVLIQGETGTGKELVARRIHEASPRKEEAFVPLSCASLPRELLEAELFGYVKGAFTGANDLRRGRFEMADRGTILLDDVDDIPLDFQVKLLRVLETMEVERLGSENAIRVNSRVLVATKCDLLEMTKQGRFRTDLYYRLNIVPILLPPLREHPTDIPEMLQHFLRKTCLRLGRAVPTVASAAISHLQAHSWPGNVRELEHLIEQTLVFHQGGELTVADFPLPEAAKEKQPLNRAGSWQIDTEGREAISLIQTLNAAEDFLIQWALTQSRGNLANAAERLGVPRSTMQYKIAKLKESSRKQRQGL